MGVFFDSWDNAIRVFITFIFVYPGLIVLLRLYGKRSLSKLNIFDFIITIALGSVFASVIILKDVTIVDGLITFSVLLSAQFLITKASIKFSFIDRLIKAEPTLVFREGEFLHDAMSSVRVSKDDILAEIRQNGIACMEDVYAVVLETNGEISVLKQKDHITTPTI